MVTMRKKLYRTSVLAFVMALAAPGLATVTPVPLPPQVVSATEGPDLDQPQAPKQGMPPIEKLALPEEQPQLAELLRSIGNVNGRGPEAMLAIFDGILAKLPRPTMLRGSVQMARAVAFQRMHRDAEATTAVEEAIRLLPGYAGPLLLAANVYLYSNNPGLASDAIVRASEIDPEDVRHLPDYETSAIMRRLGAIRDQKRARILGARLLAIGWTGSGVTSRSELAAMAIRQAVSQGDLDRAKSLIPSLLDPGASYDLLADGAYRDLWPDLERWGGPKLSSQWTMYLNEARSRWSASEDLERGADYASALRTAGDYVTLISEFLPLYDKPLDQARDWPLLFVAPKLVSALATLGRTEDAIALYDKASHVWPIGSSANALNLYANKATVLLYADRPDDALAQIDAAIADSHRWSGEINVDAVASMHQARACILHALGRDNEAAISAAVAAQAGHARQHAEVALCMDRPAEAKAALLKALSIPEERGAAIAFMQPADLPPIPTAYGRKRRADEDALRRDPQLLAALQPYGRILPFSLSDGAPKSAK